eukprot:s4489_g6.t1
MTYRWRRRVFVTGEFCINSWKDSAFVPQKAMVQLILEEQWFWRASTVIQLRCHGAIQDWAKREAPIMRACLVHALVLTKRTSKAKSATIQFVKNFITKLLVDTTGQVGIASCRHALACK